MRYTPLGFEQIPYSSKAFSGGFLPAFIIHAKYFFFLPGQTSAKGNKIKKWKEGQSNAFLLRMIQQPADEIAFLL